jgi:hypothetical protein
MRFYGAYVLLPLALGMGQALIVARAIHQPAIVLLPGARRYFRKMYALSAVASAIVVTLIARLAVPAVPLTGGVGMVLVFLSLGLLWEPFHRWYGSTGLTALIVALLIAAGLFVAFVREAVADYPSVFIGLGLLMLPAGVVLALGRERVRERAYSLLVFFGGSFRLLVREGVARQKGVGRNWERQPIGERAQAWRRALWHERFGGISRTRAWLIRLSLMIGYAVAAVVALAVHLNSMHQAVTAGAMAREFYSLIWANGVERQAMPLAPFLMGMAIVVCYALSLAFPVPAFLYPGSRRVLMRLSLQVAAIRAAIILVQGCFLIAALAWLASFLASIPFELRPTSLFVLPLTILPFLPLIAATGLSLVRRPGNPVCAIFSISGLLWMGVAMASVAGALFLSMFPQEVLTLGGATGAVAATLVTSAWLVRSARKIFLTGDLIVRSAV